MARRGRPVRRCVDSGLGSWPDLAVFAVAVGCLRFGSRREVWRTIFAPKQPGEGQQRWRESHQNPEQKKLHWTPPVLERKFLKA
jgi:hypothetical protein